MIHSNVNSYHSSPLSSIKENICPNVKYASNSNTHKVSKKQMTPSLGTDSEYSIFNTINIPKTENRNGAATKSRV